MFEAGWKMLKLAKVKMLHVILSSWNLLLLRRLQLHINFTSCNSHLTFLTLGGEFFSCLPFISRNILSAYWRWPTFSIFFFKSAEWAGNFVVHSPEVSLKIISFIGTCSGSLFEILVTWGEIVCASGNQVPIWHQPWVSMSASQIYLVNQ